MNFDDDILYFLKVYFQSGLHPVRKEYAGFLESVDETARKLYRKDHGKNPPADTGIQPF